MVYRYTVHAVTDDGPRVMTVYADGMSAEGDVTVRFHLGDQVIKRVSAECVRMIFRDADVPSSTNAVV